MVHSYSYREIKQSIATITEGFYMVHNYSYREISIAVGTEQI